MSNCSFIAAIVVAGVVLHVDSEAEPLLTKDTTHTLRIPTLFVQQFARCSLTSNLTVGFLLWSASLHLFAVTGTVEKNYSCLIRVGVSDWIGFIWQHWNSFSIKKKKKICEVVTFKTGIYRHRSPHSAKIHEQKQGNLYIYFIYRYIF